MKMSNLHLKQSPTLADFQEYVRQLEIERGFDKEKIEQSLLLLVEEIGELAKAVRKKTGLGIAQDSRDSDIAGEATDVFIFLLKVCNKANVDLEQAFREKEEKNKERVWE